MNGRVKELVRQAVIAVDDPFPGNPLNDELEKMYIPDFFSEKFAELLIRECISVIDKCKDEAIDNRWNVDEAMSVAEMELLEHFGVSES